MCLKDLRNLEKVVNQSNLGESIEKFKRKYKYVPFARFKDLYFDLKPGSAFCFDKSNGKEYADSEYNSIGFLENYIHSDNGNNNQFFRFMRSKKGN